MAITRARLTSAAQKEAGRRAKAASDPKLFGIGIEDIRTGVGIFTDIFGRPGGGGATEPLDRGALTNAPCVPGKIRVGQRCVDPSAVLPGGAPFTTTAGGVAVVGAFGMPAIQPDVEQRLVHRCPPGMVLGKFDNLCYPKVVLPRRSKFRKWKGDRRPIMSAADGSTIRKAAAIKERVLKTAKEAGLHAAKSAPRSKAKATEVVVHGGTLPVVTDHHHH